MKQRLFLFISFFLLVMASFHEPLYLLFPEAFEPVERFMNDVGSAILYCAGFLALIIATFSALPTWISLFLFVILIFMSGFYLSDKNISITIARDILITIDNRI